MGTRHRTKTNKTQHINETVQNPRVNVLTEHETRHTITRQ